MGIVDVQVAGQTHLRDRLDDGGLIGRFDRDRPARDAVGRDNADLGGTPVDGVAHAPLVDVDPAEGPSGSRDVSAELVDRVVVAAEVRDGRFERLEGASSVLDREGERRLHDGFPALQAVLRLTQQLDIHQVVADLGVAGPGTQQVDLVAFLHTGGIESSETLVGQPETGAEGAPLPARDDGRHAPPRPGGLGSAAGRRL